MLTRTADRKSQHSTISRASSFQSSITQSNNSVFSGASGYETAFSEDAYDEPRSSKTPFRPQPASHAPYFELVERGSRTGSRQSNERDQSVKASQTSFTRALAKMESAGTRIMSARLSEEWDGLDDDESFQEIMFEKRLWALTAYQRLTQNKPLQSPAHELLSNSRPVDQKRVLQVHGSLGAFTFSLRIISQGFNANCCSGWMDACEQVPFGHSLYAVFHKSASSFDISCSFESSFTIYSFTCVSSALPR